VPRKSKVPNYFLELGADWTEAFFIISATTSDRIEIVKIAWDHVVFRVVYTDRSYRFGFRFAKPCVIRMQDLRKIRIASETYRQLYRLADILMRAWLAGVQEKYQITGKGYHWLNSGDKFKIRSIRRTAFVVEAEGCEFEFRMRYVTEGERVCCLEGIEEIYSQSLRRFLFGFAELAMRAYVPYERVPGEKLAELALYPDLERETPRKSRQMRTRKRQEILKAQGKPHETKPPKKLVPPVSGNLFEPRTLPN
jgi:hypothetical protein